MENAILLQLYLFVVYFVCGIIIGIFFDIFRILRKSFNTPDIITYIEDALFWMITGIFLLWVLFSISGGQLRIYQIVSLSIGIIIYMLLVSKFFIKINVKIITFIKNIVYKIIKIILYPIKFIFKIIGKIFTPFTFFVINIKKISLKFKNKLTKKVKKENKTEKIPRERRILKRNVEKYN